MKSVSGRNYYSRRREDILQVVPGSLGRILDVGGGDGATAAMLKESGLATNVTVVDRFAEAPSADVDLFLSKDANDLDFLRGELAAHGPFDTILCLDVLEHLIDPWSVVRELSKLIVPGGFLIVSLPNARYGAVVWPLVVQGRFDYMPSGVRDRTHLRWFTKSTGAELLAVEGLRVQKIVGKLSDKGRFCNAVTLSLLKDFFVFQYLYCLQKSPAN